MSTKLDGMIDEIRVIRVKISPVPLVMPSYSTRKISTVVQEHEIHR